MPESQFFNIFFHVHPPLLVKIYLCMYWLKFIENYKIRKDSYYLWDLPIFLIFNKLRATLTQAEHYLFVLRCHFMNNAGTRVALVAKLKKGGCIVWFNSWKEENEKRV